MKIEKVLENDDNNDITNLSAYAILSLINHKIDNKNEIIDEKNIIDEFFIDYDTTIDYDMHINVANAFIQNYFGDYTNNIENTQEIELPRREWY